MDTVIEVVKRSNQRGGRMLSMVDLINADTLTARQAAWLVERLDAGASFLVGALPGGAGKTAVAGALLTMLPPGENVYVTDSGTAFGARFARAVRRGAEWRTAGRGDCLVAYEISPASYEAYIWGEELRTFVERGKAGARLAANLHADTLEQAREQIVTDNGVEPGDFDTFDLFFPISMSRKRIGTSRRIDYVDFRDGTQWQRIERKPELSPRGKEILSFLTECADDGAVTIEAVRERWLQFTRGTRGTEAPQ